MELVPGAILNGQYELLGPLGKGGMGSVWRATQLSVRAPVALKVIKAELPYSEVVAARFRREAQAAAALRGDPNVVQVIDYGVDERFQLPYLAMELLKGVDLSHYLEQRAKLSPGETLHILKQVGRAVARAHDLGIVHRDLKPANVFLVEGEELLVKVLDFGIAKTSERDLEAPTTKTGTVLGTAHYMSPEQVRGRAVDARTDLWALAVMAFECLIGVRPFEATSLSELTLLICTEPLPVPSLFGSVPPGFDRWFEKATQRKPEARFQSAKELIESLSDVCGRPLTSVPLVNNQRPFQPTREIPTQSEAEGTRDVGSALLSGPIGQDTETLAPHLASRAESAFDGKLARQSAKRRAWYALPALGAVGLAVVFAWTARGERDEAAADPGISSEQGRTAGPVDREQTLAASTMAPPPDEPDRTPGPAIPDLRHTAVQESLSSVEIRRETPPPVTAAPTSVAAPSASPVPSAQGARQKTAPAIAIPKPPPKKRSGGDAFLTRQ